MQPTARQESTMFINLILQSAFLFAPTGSWNLFSIKSAALFGLVFFQVYFEEKNSQYINTIVTAVKGLPYDNNVTLILF